MRTYVRNVEYNRSTRIRLFGGAEGALILFSEIGFSMASCSYIYVRVASRNCTLGTLKRNGFLDISVYLHAFCTILRSLVALGTSVTKKL